MYTLAVLSVGSKSLMLVSVSVFFHGPQCAFVHGASGIALVAFNGRFQWHSCMTVTAKTVA